MTTDATTSTYLSRSDTLLDGRCTMSGTLSSRTKWADMGFSRRVRRSSFRRAPCFVLNFFRTCSMESLPTSQMHRYLPHVRGHQRLSRATYMWGRAARRQVLLVMHMLWRSL